MRHIRSVLLCSSVLLLSGCQPCSVVSVRGEPLMISNPSVSLGVVGQTDHYTIQGVMLDEDVPITGLRTMGATILVDGAPISGSTTYGPVVFDEQGRFSARFELGVDPEPLVESSDVVVQMLIFNGLGYVEAGEPIAIDLAPRAYSSVYAIRSGTSDFADSADEANALTDVGVTDLAPFYQPGWSDYGLGYQELRATRRGNLVTIEGLTRKVATPTDDVIVILPEDLRPNARLIFMAYGIDTYPGIGPVYRIDVYPDGRVEVIEPTPVAPMEWISLTGLSYRVD